MDTENDTLNRILQAASRLFMAHGIKRVSLEEVAAEAGLTRVTIYRYFANKRELVRAFVFQPERVFQQALQSLEDHPDVDPLDVLDQIGQGLAALPKGDLFARVAELERLYPDIYTEFQQNRLKVQGELFTRLFDLCDQQGILRPGLNRDVTRAIIWEIMVNILRSPNLASLGLSDADLFHSVSDIIRYGIAGGTPRSSDSG